MTRIPRPTAPALAAALRAALVLSADCDECVGILRQLSGSGPVRAREELASDSALYGRTEAAARVRSAVDAHADTRSDPDW
ncbi:hypothetical protein [Rhodococcus chondri]|uniref:Uncharacterized protein n=1 Tax=Rhodococcus chondri TaxID=3065941 RepID=A0ABU7JTP9_9NOCA|nr:hypothetical protein [Rhodococcus sp. CC-R104]MEE2033398.1 hypothetical protein [Rhodococcus sp. CC-R104]